MNSVLLPADMPTTCVHRAISLQGGCIHAGCAADVRFFHQNHATGNALSRLLSKAHRAPYALFGSPPAAGLNWLLMAGNAGACGPSFRRLRRYHFQSHRRAMIFPDVRLERCQADCRMTSVPCGRMMEAIVLSDVSTSPNSDISASTLLAVMAAKSWAIVVNGGQA